MSRSMIIGLLMLAVAVGQTVAVSADNTSKELAARVEAIPLQTLTVTGCIADCPRLRAVAGSHLGARFRRL